MSFPANAIGLAAAAGAGGFVTFQACKGTQGQWDWLIFAVLLIVAVYFGLVLS